MGYSVTFTPRDSVDGATAFEVEGDDRDEFLGDSSEMLEALAHLSMRFQRKKAGASNDSGAEAATGDYRVIFDAGDFRQRKIDELRDLAADKRQRVLDNSGKPAYINALGPAERKVIHTTLTELGDVVSESIGSGYFKRIRVRLIDDKRPQREGGGQRAEGGGGNGNGGGGRRGGRGGRGRGRGRGGNGNGNGQPRAPRDGNEVNGNFVPQVRDDSIDDNIGNRLAPGEEPIFNVDATGGDADDRN